MDNSNKFEATLVYFINDVAEWFKDDNPFEGAEFLDNSCPNCGEQVRTDGTCDCQD